MNKKYLFLWIVYAGIFCTPKVNHMASNSSHAPLGSTPAAAQKGFMANAKQLGTKVIDAAKRVRNAVIKPRNDGHTIGLATPPAEQKGFMVSAKKLGNNVIDAAKRGGKAVIRAPQEAYYSLQKKAYQDTNSSGYYNAKRYSPLIRKIDTIADVSQSSQMFENLNKIVTEKVTGAGIYKLKDFEKQVDRILVKQEKLQRDNLALFKELPLQGEGSYAPVISQPKPLPNELGTVKNLVDMFEEKLPQSSMKVTAQQDSLVSAPLSAKKLYRQANNLQNVSPNSRSIQGIIGGPRDYYSYDVSNSLKVIKPSSLKQLKRMRRSTYDLLSKDKTSLSPTKSKDKTSSPTRMVNEYMNRFDQLSSPANSTNQAQSSIPSQIPQLKPMSSVSGIGGKFNSLNGLLDKKSLEMLRKENTELKLPFERESNNNAPFHPSNSNYSASVNNSLRSVERVSTQGSTPSVIEPISPIREVHGNINRFNRSRFPVKSVIGIGRRGIELPSDSLILNQNSK